MKIIKDFMDVVRACPERVAVAGAGGTSTYAALAGRVDSLARALGVGPGDRVLVVADERAGVIAALLACLKIGAVFVAVEPDGPYARLVERGRLVAPRVIVCGDSRREVASALADELGARVVGIDAASEASLVARVSAADDPAYIVFTSGSTGRPKAILGRLGAVEHFTDWEREHVGLTGEACRVSQLVHPAYDAFLRDALLPLTTGGVACVPDGRPAGAELLAYLRAERVAVVHTVPSVLRTLLDVDDWSGLALRHVLLAGEALLPADARRWFERTGGQVALTNLYGPSETTMTKLFHRVAPADVERAVIPVGRAMPEVRVLLIDEDGGCAAPGAIGEILIQTRHAALGYWGDAEATARAFVADPSGEDRTVPVYRTGDFGRTLADGSIEFLGRRDRQIKLRGVRVELDEIEGVLATCDGVREAAVIARDDGRGGLILAGYVAPANLSEAALRAELAARLPAGLVPGVIVRLAGLPRTISDKVDRRNLPDPALVRRREDPGFVAPETPLEQALAELWSAVLGVADISLADNFFELGGDSLLATRVLAGVSELHGVRVRLVEFLERPTLRDLALAVLERGLLALEESGEAERVLAEVEAQEDVEAQLAEFYGRFPWPWEAASFDVLADPRLETLLRNQDVGDWQHGRIPVDGRIWVAGCGTNQAVITALRFPLARVLGTDLSETSLARARETARALGLRNLELARESIADSTYRDEFDQVICTGVIHHNADPAGLLGRLGRAMKPRGILELMVYSVYHRQVTTAFQGAVRALCPGDPFEVQIAVARGLLAVDGVREGLGRAFTQFMDWSESDLADLLIQPVERSYTVDELAAMSDGAGLRLLAPCISAYARSLDRAAWDLELADPLLRERYERLADPQRWQITQRILHERSPLLWFYLERRGANGGDSRSAIAAMLDTRFCRVATQKRSHVRQADGGYVASPRTVQFPGAAADPSVRGVLAEIRPERTLSEVLAAAGVEPEIGVLRRVRRSLTTSAFPYVLAEAGRGHS